MSQENTMFLTDGDMRNTLWTYNEKDEIDQFVQDSISGITLPPFFWPCVILGYMLGIYFIGFIASTLIAICAVVYFKISVNSKKNEKLKESKEYIIKDMFNRRMKKVEIHNQIMTEIHDNGFQLTHKAFDPSFSYCIGIDKNSKKFFIQRENNYNIFTYNDLIDFEYIEDQKKYTVNDIDSTKVALAGVLMKDMTAAVLMGKNEVEEDYCGKMLINITVNNCDDLLIKIPFIESIVDRENDKFEYYKDRANKMLSILKIIKNG